MVSMLQCYNYGIDMSYPAKRHHNIPYHNQHSSEILPKKSP